MTTRSSLGIIWTARSAAGVRQAEVPGIIFYGYFPERALPEVSGGDICRIWPSGAVQSVVRHWREHQVVSLELRILSWPEPSEWASVVERSLRWFIEVGAVVSWCGDETSTPSVTILDPAEPDGIVYAAFALTTGFLCNSDLDEEFSFLNDDQLERLWAVVSPPFPRRMGG